jgi:hypothetical protein
MTAHQADLLSSAALTFEVVAPTGKTLSTSGGSNAGSANIGVSVQGKNYFTIRVVNQVLYLQANLKDFLNAIGQQQAYQQIAGAGGQLPGFLTALVQGKWVSLPLSTLKGLAGSLGAGAPSPSSTTQAQHLIDKLKSLLTKDVTVTKSSSGGTDTLTLTTNLRSFVGDVTTTFGSSIPGAGAALGSADLSGVPNKSVSLVATVSGGALSSLSFDLGQVAKTSGKSLPLQLGFVRSGPAITAPSGAVAVDLSQLGGLINAFGGGGF